MGKRGLFVRKQGPRAPSCGRKCALIQEPRPEGEKHLGPRRGESPGGGGTRGGGHTAGTGAVREVGRAARPLSLSLCPSPNPKEARDPEQRRSDGGKTK